MEWFVSCICQLRIFFINDECPGDYRADLGDVSERLSLKERHRGRRVGGCMYSRVRDKMRK